MLGLGIGNRNRDRIRLKVSVGVRVRTRVRVPVGVRVSVRFRVHICMHPISTVRRSSLYPLKYAHRRPLSIRGCKIGTPPQKQKSKIGRVKYTNANDMS